MLRLTALAPMLVLLLACGGHTGTDGGGDGSTTQGDGTGGNGDGSTTGMDGSTTGTDGSMVGTDIGPNDGEVQVSEGGTTVHDPDGGTWVCHTVSCAGHVLQCGDCTDNDGDGLIDSHDPDCIGPCSNSESNLFGSVGGSSASACNLNCYFDFGQGGGTGCTWDHECDPLTPVSGCPYVPPANRNAGLAMKCPANQTMMCHNECEPLTPNGCDCFGCCQFGSQFLYIGSRDAAGAATCTIELARAGDTAACHACTPVRDAAGTGFSCGNPCGRCEYCIDGHVPEASCYTTPPPVDAGTYPDGGHVPPPDSGSTPADGGVNTMQCPAGINPCGAGDTCPVNYYCITGCCEQIPA